MKDFLLFILLKHETLTCIHNDSIQSHNHITGCSIIYSKTILFFAFDLRNSQYIDDDLFGTHTRAMKTHFGRTQKS